MADVLATPEARAILFVIGSSALALLVQVGFSRYYETEEDDDQIDASTWWIIPATAALLYILGAFGTPFFA